MRQRRTAPGADSGFTLVELLITIVLVGIIAPLLVSVMAVSLRSLPRAEERTDDARTLQGVVTWLPQDVDSTPPDGFDLTPATASGCTTSPGVSLLRMEWTEYTGSNVVRFVANYRLAPVNGVQRIVRISCSGTGAGPLGSTRVINASSALPVLPAGWTPGTLPYDVSITVDPVTAVRIVTFRVQTLTGKLLQIDSAPKNPANTLAPTSTTPVPTVTTSTTTTTTTTTIPGTTTTVVGTTTLPPSTTTTTTTLPPCVVTAASLSPASVKNTDPNGNGKSSTNVGVLADPVTLTITTTGSCVGLEARATTGAPNGELFRNFTLATGSTYTVTFPGYPQGSSELWADGSRQISVYDSVGGPYTTVLLDVK